MRPIDADAPILKNDLRQCIRSFERMKKGGIGIADEIVCQTCKRALEYIDKIEAEPVRHGKWIGADSVSLYCSECGKSSDYKVDGSCKASLYCPQCGAKMDGVEVNNA